MNDAVMLTRFSEGADQEVRRNFGRDLLTALDHAGVNPGEDFVVVNAADYLSDPGGK